MTTYQNVVGDDTVNLQAQEWQAKLGNETFKQYYTNISDSIPTGNFAAYDIQKIVDDSGTYDINILMLCSLESDAGFGSFTGSMLNAMARQLTGS